MAIKSHALPANAGIWSLGRPKLRHALSLLPEIPSALIGALETADEFSALGKLVGSEALDSQLDELIQELLSSLTGLAGPILDIEVEPPTYGASK